jgi:CheY-like chemotaxis protein
MVMAKEPCRVLLVEDDDDHAELMLRNLRDSGTNQVMRLADGEAALDYLHRRGAFAAAAQTPLPDVVLLDLRLPKVDGLQVLKEIKSSEALRRIPVVVLTTSESEMDLVRAYDLAANAYVVKPVDFYKFVAMMHDIGVFWLAWNRPASGKHRANPSGSSG